MKGLTSHVLDTLNGRPATGVLVELWSCNSESKQLQVEKLINSSKTNEEGRCLLADELAVARYEIRFFIGDYFSREKNQLAEPSFLDIVSVRFAVADSEQHYHIPLVASPWSYTTYKGGAPKNH